MNRPTYRVRQGGLMRCCLASLDGEMERREKAGTTLAVEGEVFNCEYCKSPMRVRDGAWEWAKDLDPR